MTQGFPYILLRVILGLKSLVKAQMEQQRKKLNNWYTLVKKVIDNLQTLIFREIDQHCSQDNHLAHIIVTMFQVSATWDL